MVSAIAATVHDVVAEHEFPLLLSFICLKSCLTNCQRGLGLLASALAGLVYEVHLH